ncbi:proteoglycan 4a [Labrus bergylta]|uniref:proteoglycan 4a n=1 Tax=Labrus bergylta TaxID=56723 RepID=UPI0009B440D8|nr:proteoglycan 4-like [Labrus bergylta]
MKMFLWLLLLGFGMTYTAATGPDSCVGRCGESFTRGQQCTCDFSCLQHNECCHDFEATCSTGQSCRGRCGEAFRRGQLCECDPECVHYNTCCHDYQGYCDTNVAYSHPRTVQALRSAVSEKRKSKRGKKSSNSESEEWYTARSHCSQYPGAPCSRTSGVIKPSTASSSGPTAPANPSIPLQHGVRNIPTFHGRAPESPASGSSLPSYNAQSQGSNTPVRPSASGADGGTLNVHLLIQPGEVAPSAPSQDYSDPAGPADPRPSTLQDVAQAFVQSLVKEDSEGPVTGVFADQNLCSDSPINGLTVLSNGTMLIFKGELFWSVNPVSRSVGRPKNILDNLGVPSPIDTIFTRCNCKGNTYIIKGDQYWLLDENMVMEPGFPKPLASEFPGLTGSISAALAAPATRSRSETVFFFKKGDVIQRFTFPSGSTPSCGNRQSRFSLQAEVLLSKEIKIKSSLKGFPIPVTSALSIPSPRRSDPYQHYVFSGSLFFNIKISGNLPALAKPDPDSAFAPLPLSSPALAAPNTAAQNRNPPQPTNSIKVWLQCP